MFGLALHVLTFPLAVPPTTNIVTNICNLRWNYCPRDPGCITYTMSVLHYIASHMYSGRAVPTASLPRTALATAGRRSLCFAHLTARRPYRILSHRAHELHYVSLT